MNQRTGNQRKCGRSEKTVRKGRALAYCRNAAGAPPSCGSSVSQEMTYFIGIS